MVLPEETRRAEPEHVVQFFDDEESQAAGVASFMNDGFRGGTAVMAVIKDSTLRRVVELLGRPTIEGHQHSGQLLLLDAHMVLARLLRHNNLPDASSFNEIIVPAVERLGAGCRVYGEVVDILAEETNFAAVHQLETLWRELGARLPFTLLCGYRSAHFAAPTASGMMRGVCHLHQRVERHADDLLANWLLDSQVAN